MASSPSYGERPPLQGFRRSFTTPHRQLSFHERAGLSSADADSDTLFTHPSVKIISFSPPPESIVSESGATHADADYPIDTVETLPWRSRTEDLVASGRMIIEKIRGSVWFLKCGSQFVYSILRNSQCWCVDGESRFVLRKGRLQYYRLELPNGTEEDKAKIEELKAAFSKVLKFERTPCPFKRGFHVDLPDDAITPRRKGKWTKKEGSLPATPDSHTPSLRRTKGTRSWSLQAQSPLPVPESRRQSDYSFAKRLLPTPPRRDALSGLRPGTPSSTASSEEATSHGQQDDFSDSGSSIDEPVLADKEVLPEAAVDGEEFPVKSNVPEMGPLVDENGGTSVSLNHSTVIEEASPQVVEGPFAPITQQESNSDGAPSREDGFDQVESDTVKVADGDTPEEELSSEETLVKTAQIEDESNLDGSEDDEVRQEPSLPERPESPLEDDLSQPETRATIATDDDESSAPQPVESDSLDDRDAPDTLGSEDHSPVEHQSPQQAQTPQVDDESPESPQTHSESPKSDEALDETASIASAAESFHTSASDDQTLPNTVPEAGPLTEEVDVRHPQHKRGVSEMTITTSNYDEQIEGEQLDRFVTSDEIADRPSTPRLVQSSASDDSWPDVKTPSNIQDGLRQRWNTRRALSPLPSSPNVFTTQTQTQGNHMTSVLLQKACNLALVKPIELAVMVVHILARIAGGASLNDLLTGELFKRPDQHRRNSSFPDRISPHQDDDEDDFGVPIRGRTRSSETDVFKDGRDTDADSMLDLD